MLSERIRPDVEAAPWVIEEVKRLEERAKFFAAAVEKYGKHDPTCLWATPLATGQGYCGCDCGLGVILLEAETPLYTKDLYDYKR